MNKLILSSISEVKTEKKRKDDKVSRQYFTAYFLDPQNPLTGTSQRNFFQDITADGKTAYWKNGRTPAVIASFVGKELTGDIVRMEVKPYAIGENQVSHFTAVVLKGETPAMLAKENGHELAAVAIVAAPAGQLAE